MPSLTDHVHITNKSGLRGPRDFLKKVAFCSDLTFNMGVGVGFPSSRGPKSTLQISPYTQYMVRGVGV
jgi:hypothetical protein